MPLILTPASGKAMCNLYSMTTNQQAIRNLFKVKYDRAGNLPILPGIFPDQPAPIVRQAADGERELIMARWGMPTPPQFREGPVDRGVTSIRNLASPHWRNWLKPENRCLVPATSFCEYTDSQPKVPHWFALDDDRPLFAFAGIWCTWTGARGSMKSPVEGNHLLYGFLTSEANEVVRPIHAKAMPVMLTSPEECDTWLSAEPTEALKLQRPSAADQLKIVAKGQREDGVPESQPSLLDIR
jgi:putative SOS response-associated peptidase YedK